MYMVWYRVYIYTVYVYIYNFQKKNLPAIAITMLQGATITDGCGDSTHIACNSRADVWVSYCRICFIDLT